MSSAAAAASVTPSFSARSLRWRRAKSLIVTSNLSVCSPSAMARCSVRRRRPSTVQEAAQFPRPRGVLQLAQGLGLDLADAFAGDAELLADLFEGVVGVHADAEAHAQHAFFTGRQRRQHAR